MSDLFPGFSSHRLDTEIGRAFVRKGGEGPPVLLLHGFPQTHVCWHRIAPELAKTHTVVAMDLRGYGWSTAPEGDPAHEAYSKRAMGRDAVRVMSDFGFARSRSSATTAARGWATGFAPRTIPAGSLALGRSMLDNCPADLPRFWREIDRRAGFPAVAFWNSSARPAPEPRNGPSARTRFRAFASTMLMAGPGRGLVRARLAPFERRAPLG